MKPATPSRSTTELMWLHHVLFVEFNASAGQLRSDMLAWHRAGHDRPELIRASRDDRFGELYANSALLGLGRDELIEKLAYHVSQLNAIACFAVGNRGLLGLHATQIANAAGHGLFVLAIPRSLLDGALFRSFVERDISGIAALLRGETSAGAVPHRFSLNLLS